MIVQGLEESDWPFFEKLLLQLQLYSLPPGRKITREEHARNISEALKKLRIRRKVDPNLAIFLLREGAEPAGYVVLELADTNPVTLTRQAYLFDIGIAPGQWGKFRWRALMERAFEHASSAGYAFLGGTVTRENLRCLKPALRFLRFRSIGSQWVFSIAGEQDRSLPQGAAVFRKAGDLEKAHLESALQLMRENFLLRAQLCGLSLGESLEEHLREWQQSVFTLMQMGKAVLITAGDTGKKGYLILDLNHPEPATGEREGAILDLSLHEDAWKGGVAGTLLEAARALCRSAGLPYLVAHLPNFHEPYMREGGAVLERYEILKTLR